MAEEKKTPLEALTGIVGEEVTVAALDEHIKQLQLYREDLKNDEVMATGHIDDWIDDWRNDEDYATFFFWLHRLPAWLKFKWEKYFKQFKLFCTYEGKRFRVTGASSMGDIWLHEDFSRDSGYKHRVDVRECSEFSAEP